MFSVQVSYFEIYNEKVYDLLNSSGKPSGKKQHHRPKVSSYHSHRNQQVIPLPSLQLRVREHQVFGPYVEDLSTYVATSFADIEVSTPHHLHAADSAVLQHWLLVGNRCRATSATSMNDRSSRSHAVFCVTLTHTTV